MVVTLRDSDGTELDFQADLDGTTYNLKTALMGGPTHVYQEITRPSNTTPYSAGDTIAANSASAATQYIVVGRLNGLGGKITQVDVMTDNRAWTAGIKVVLYDDEPTAFTADNAAFPGRAYADKAGVIGIASVTALAADADVAGAMAVGSIACDLNFQCAAASKNIYFQLFTAGTPTPASAQKFTIVLHITQN